MRILAVSPGLWISFKSFTKCTGRKTQKVLTHFPLTYNNLHLHTYNLSHKMIIASHLCTADAYMRFIQGKENALC